PTASRGGTESSPVLSRPAERNVLDGPHIGVLGNETDEQTRAFQRKSCEVRSVLRPRTRQVVLDIRNVEDGYGGVVVLQILPDCFDGFRPCKISDDRDNQILLLHRPNE